MSLAADPLLSSSSSTGSISPGVDVASKTWTAVRRVFVPKGHRTQPGVLTPGNRSKKARPEGAADRRLVRLGLTYLRTVLPPLWGERFSCRHLGLKPQAQS